MSSNVDSLAGEDEVCVQFLSSGGDLQNNERMRYQQSGAEYNFIEVCMK